jgi:hypothetical protein
MRIEFDVVVISGRVSAYKGNLSGIRKNLLWEEGQMSKRRSESGEWERKTVR